MSTNPTCICCAAVLGRPSGGPRLFCASCSMQQRTETWRACRAVGLAVARGTLPAANTQVCVDCGRPARVYDHRDYTQPLKVAPVCGRCNVLRGPALNSRMRSLPAAA